MTKQPRTVLILKPSSIHGVGVFATRRLARREPLSRVLFPQIDWRHIPSVPKHEVDKRFVILLRRGLYQPTNPHRLCIGWYLNHSDRPTIDTFTWQPTRIIRRDEELTIDYNVLDSL